jgi:hypothetical protein
MRGGFTRENGSSVFLCVCVWGGGGRGGGVTRDEGDEGAQG